MRQTVLPDADVALVVMGFDPDRARLIDAVLIAVLAAAIARLATDTRAASVIGGLVAFGLVFGDVFTAETVAAIAAGGVAGRFDPLGWIATVATLLVVVAVIGFATSLLVGHLRAFAVAASRDARALARSQAGAGRQVVRPLSLVIALVLVGLTLPLFAEMLNYTPDLRMRAGAPAQPGLVGGDPYRQGASPARPVNASSSPPPADPVLDLTRAEIGSSTPWLAGRPAGAGRWDHLTFPAPWSGGRSSVAMVNVWLPPGYDGPTTQRYPVVYSAPFATDNLSQALEGPVRVGEVPAEIVVAIDQTGGPYPDSECVNSSDGKQHFEDFVVTTVVPWIDAHYRTVASRSARTLAGWSTGGFCAAMLLFRHQDVFGQAVAMSGYYVAGVSSGATVNAFRPFGGDHALERSYSPIDLAPGLAPKSRHSIFVVVSGDPNQPFYGRQMEEFVGILRNVGIPHAVIRDPLGHSWAAFGRDLPAAIHLVGLRQADAGLFAPPSRR